MHPQLPDESIFKILSESRLPIYVRRTMVLDYTIAAMMYKWGYKLISEGFLHKQRVKMEVILHWVGW